MQLAYWLNIWTKCLLIGGNFLNSSRRGARAISPRVALNASASYCLTFWYYVVAGSSHPLVVYVSSEQAYVHPEWNHGNTRGRWTMGEVYISQRPSVQVIFSADNQDNGLGLVAIDDISILEGVCSGGIRSVCSVFSVSYTRRWIVGYRLCLCNIETRKLSEIFKIN